MRYDCEQPVTLDESINQLHQYHPTIIDVISVELNGLIGNGNTIQSISVAEPLSDSDKSSLENYLGTDLMEIDTS